MNEFGVLGTDRLPERHHAVVVDAGRAIQKSPQTTRRRHCSHATPLAGHPTARAVQQYALKFGHRRAQVFLRAHVEIGAGVGEQLLGMCLARG